jgi:hypothetical protein
MVRFVYDILWYSAKRCDEPLWKTMHISSPNLEYHRCTREKTSQTSNRGPHQVLFSSSSPMGLNLRRKSRPRQYPISRKGFTPGLPAPSTSSLCELRFLLHLHELWERDWPSEFPTWLTNLCVRGHVNSCGVNSLKVCATLHRLAEERRVAKSVSHHRARSMVAISRRAYLSMSMRLIFRRYVPGSAIARSEKTA